MIDLLNSKIFGMNVRNRYIEVYNNTKSMILVTNKVLFNLVLRENKIPTTKIIETYAYHDEIKDILKLDAPFVIKPSHGSSGSGILILKRKERDWYYTRHEKMYHAKGVIMHLNTILDGEFSTGFGHDTVMIEEFLEPDRKVEMFCRKGLADIRIIYFLGVPIVSMMRIPNEFSQGKANLSQGAYGASINLKSGKVESVYDPISKKRIPMPEEFRVKLPNWSEVIEIGRKASYVSGLGLCGVDIVYTNRGPLVMECNARPGLEVQNVTRKRMLFDIERVEGKHDPKKIKDLVDRNSQRMDYLFEKFELDEI